MMSDDPRTKPLAATGKSKWGRGFWSNQTGLSVLLADGAEADWESAVRAVDKLGDAGRWQTAAAAWPALRDVARPTQEVQPDSSGSGMRGFMRKAFFGLGFENDGSGVTVIAAPGAPVPWEQAFRVLAPDIPIRSWEKAVLRNSELAGIATPNPLVREA